MQQIMAQKEELKKEIEIKIDQQHELQKQLAELEDSKNRVDIELLKEKERVKEMVLKLDESENTRKRTERQKEGFEEEKNALAKDKAELIKNLDQTEKEKQKYVATAEELQKENDRLEQTKSENAKTIKDIQNELEKHYHKLSKQSEALEKEKARNHELQTNYDQLSMTNHDLEKQLNNTRRNLNQAQMLAAKNESERNAARDEKETALQQISGLMREIEKLHKDTEHEKSDIMKLVRDRDIIKRQLHIASENNEQRRNEITQKQQTIATITDQNNKYKENIQQLLKSVKDISKERDSHQKQAQKNQAQLMGMLEEVKLKKNLVSELKKETVELEAKLKQQQNLYEAVRSEKNLYSKNLLEAQDDVAELNRKFKIAQHQITQLKEEIEAKDQALTAEHFDHGMSIKKADLIKIKLDSEVSAHKKAQETIEENKQEIIKLNYIIKDTTMEHELTKKEMQKTVNERDILGTQLIRRNDELALLYEKIKILQTTLAKGELQYQERLEDIKLLKFCIGDLKCELRIVKN